MRFRPRFSIRTLAIVVTLVCAYFGAWEMTKGAAVRQQRRCRIYSLDGKELLPTQAMNFSEQQTKLLNENIAFSIVETSDSPAPCVIARNEVMIFSAPVREPNRRTYHLWFFGHIVKLPFESTW